MASRLSPWAACRTLVSRSRPRLRTQQPSISTAFARHLASQPPTSQTPDNNGASIPPIHPSMRPPGESSNDAEQAPQEEGAESRLLSPKEAALMQLELTAEGVNPFEYTGLKFEEPPMPTGKLHEAQYHMRFRYEEGIAQITRLLMRDGKLGKAQNDMAMVLNYLRTSPPPKINPQKPLLPGSPPPQHLPLNPDLYLMLAIDSVAPLVRLRGFSGLAGGGKPLEIPIPMNRRARRRTAFMWIMDVVNKKESPGSGRKMLPHRIGSEIVAVAQGTSSVWERRQQLHKQAMTIRANLNSPRLQNVKIF